MAERDTIIKTFNTKKATCTDNIPPKLKQILFGSCKILYSELKILLPGVLQGSILVPIFLNIFLNDIFLYIKNADLHNFTDNDKFWLLAAWKTYYILLKLNDLETTPVINLRRFQVIGIDNINPHLVNTGNKRVKSQDKAKVEKLSKAVHRIWKLKQNN